MSEKLEGEKFSIHNALSMDAVVHHAFNSKKAAITVVTKHGQQVAYQIDMQVIISDAQSGKIIGALPVFTENGPEFLEADGNICQIIFD